MSDHPRGQSGASLLPTGRRIGKSWSALARTDRCAALRRAVATGQSRTRLAIALTQPRSATSITRERQSRPGVRSALVADALIGRRASDESSVGPSARPSRLRLRCVSAGASGGERQCDRDCRFGEFAAVSRARGVGVDSSARAALSWRGGLQAPSAPSRAARAGSRRGLRRAGCSAGCDAAPRRCTDAERGYDRGRLDRVLRDVKER
jgi:hypothetical protein